jgi:hypothetical protein
MDAGLAAELSPQQQGEIAALASELNDRLVQAGSSYAERAFGLSCGLGFLPAMAVLVALIVFRVINVILAFILFVIIILGLTGLSNLLAYTARLNAVRRTYGELVEPEILRYLSLNAVSRVQFDTCAFTSLAEDAPLRAYLAPALPDAAEDEEDHPASESIEGG